MSKCDSCINIKVCRFEVMDEDDCDDYLIDTSCLENVRLGFYNEFIKLGYSEQESIDLADKAMRPFTVNTDINLETMEKLLECFSKPINHFYGV